MTASHADSRSYTASKFRAEHKLPPPLWEWAPFLLGLPVEVKELIFSNFDFQLPSSAHSKLNSFHAKELLRKGSSLEHSHPFNTLAATSRSMRATVESNCQHLLDANFSQACDKCPSTAVFSKANASPQLAATVGEHKEAKAPNQLGRVHTTRRGIWLRHVTHSCAFCGHKTANLVCPFNRLIRTCKECEYKQWPKQILLEEAMEKLSLHHLLWPPQGYVLQWARESYGTPFTPGPRFRDLLLNDEVEAIAKVIEENPIRHIPVWAMHGLTAEFKKRLPWDQEAEESQDANDVDFDLDI